MIDAKLPAKNAEHERADEIAILDARLLIDRDVGRHRSLADSREDAERSLAIGHASLVPAVMRAPRA